MFVLLQTLFFTVQYIYLHNPRLHNECCLRFLFFWNGWTVASDGVLPVFQLELTLIFFISIFLFPYRPVAIFAVTQFRGRSNRCSCQILSKYWSLLYQNRDSLLQALTSPHGAFLSQKSLCLSRFWENKKPDVTLCAMILYKSIQEGTAQRRGKVNLKLSEKAGHIYDI